MTERFHLPAMLSLPLHDIEIRVLGSLLEKEITTPEYYPMTLNALLNACNQRSNREPMVDYDEDILREALQLLRNRGLLTTVSGAGHRVEKYGHRLTSVLNLGRREEAVLCTLMLRGPQTLAEVRDRSERMHRFSDLEEAERALEQLANRPGQPLVAKMGRQPGWKEPRYAHLLAGEPAPIPETPTVIPTSDRYALLEREIESLRARMDELEKQLAAFRRQFE